MQDQDQTEPLVEQVRHALSTKTPVNIVGGNSKSFLGRPAQATSLSITGHTGVVSYEPTELVVTVRAGTSMQSLNALLKDNAQMLPFEPPVFNTGTIGGVLACGLSGPARPFAGSARDYVLGMRVINGQAQALRFGGEVMKNVAGYDAARLHVGAFGTLGVLLETSMKVLPVPEYELTLQHTLGNANDSSGLIKLMRQSLPMSAACIVGPTQYVRLSGSESAVKAAAKTCGGEPLGKAADFWQSIRECSHPFFNDTIHSQSDDKRALWRISVPEFAPLLPVEGEWLLDWAGAQRYLKTDAPADTIFASAKQVGGHATCYTPDRVSADTALFQPLDGVMQTLQKRVRDSFDAHRLFNPGRYHTELDDELNRASAAEK